MCVCVCVCEWMCSWVGWSAALPVSRSFLYSLKNKNKPIIRMMVNQQLLSYDHDEDILVAGYSCQLLTQTMELIIINERSLDVSHCFVVVLVQEHTGLMLSPALMLNIATLQVHGVLSLQLWVNTM